MCYFNRLFKDMYRWIIMYRRKRQLFKFFFRYCLFGDTVNMASRMESTGVANKIQVCLHTTPSGIKSLMTVIWCAFKISEQAHNLLHCFFQQFIVVERGKIEVKVRLHVNPNPSFCSDLQKCCLLFGTTVYREKENAPRSTSKERKVDEYLTDKVVLYELRCYPHPHDSSSFSPTSLFLSRYFICSILSPLCHDVVESLKHRTTCVQYSSGREQQRQLRMTRVDFFAVKILSVLSVWC